MRKIIAGFVALAALALATPSSPASAGVWPSQCLNNNGSICIDWQPGGPFGINATVYNGGFGLPAICLGWTGNGINDSVRLRVAPDQTWGNNYRYLDNVDSGGGIRCVLSSADAAFVYQHTYNGAVFLWGNFNG